MSVNKDQNTAVVVSAILKPTRKVYRPRQKAVSRIPTEISEHPGILKAISVLPGWYNFEIPKTIWRIRKCNSKCVALQFPEGLLIFALTISDILEAFCNVQTIIMADVTYGACCIDDFTARALGADLMIHYGHSCLIPVNMTDKINMMYVFTDMKMDTFHLIQTIGKNFDHKTNIVMLTTIQFVSCVQRVAADLINLAGYQIYVPQCKPLSPGEVLGCTSPIIENADNVVFVGDGRFHLESVMIANPSKQFYRYNPYDKKFTKESYDYDKMMDIRKKAIETASNCDNFGLILGTLGRQGSPKVMDNIKTILKRSGKRHVTVLLSEIFPHKLNLFCGIESWIQIACPRLSIDWGYAFDKPLLTPYEFAVVSKEIKWQSKYPMDYYGSKSLGSWTPNHVPNEESTSCGKCADCECSTGK